MLAHENLRFYVVVYVFVTNKNWTTSSQKPVSAGSEMKPQTYDGGYGNKLLCQGCGIPHGTVVE
jgi:hypothetical protein